jgi:hypothetical protein
MEQITSPASSITSPRSNRSARRRSIATSFSAAFDLALFGCIASHFLAVFFLDLRREIGILRRGQREFVQEHFVAVAADVLRLIIGPLVGSLGLQQQLFRVRAVTEQRDGCHEHGKNGHGQRYGSEARFMRPMFGVLLQFLKFFGHSRPPIGSVAGFMRGKE